ncbi:hypothetical protein J8I87_07865 [Paraburkholderia sp. LEh10]|uniref:hypothetical protein n=1 Tax=Paraburkholderia sp. LEh10 TaxID=2821353 RepID=UPI001AE8A323|nr:hypothetical protein [Paraburkholderia sp. LEh10]MBP0589635.1 hypothetical protein [Paraburkholderia sp. LEh10]
MFRTALLATSLVLAALSQAAHAGQPAVAGALSAGSSAVAPGASAAPAADKVYPPLPTLAMLPPTSADDDEPLAPKPAAKKRKTRAPVDVRPSTPAVRLVVSDASRTYLRTVEKQLELALAK